MKDIPQAISQLQLIVSFKGYMVSLKDCLEIHSEKEFYAFEPDDLKYSICSKSIPFELRLNNEYFTIKNISKKDIIFWAIDGKFLTTSKQQRCDCAIFDDKILCLVEFKTRSEGRTPETREETILHAQKQIISTYELIKNQIKKQGIDLLDKVTLEGHICISKRYPRISSEEMNMQALFAEKNGFGLYFDGIKEF
ncbi:hypothetical protein [uncultured Parabacteroides sp.]|uniref:hypothetical protein n=1 Tax=uncultured Parabacteroides sp. TaxID=512312 RepID=UPI00259B6CA3|nr:hypothetical protein [uncultured Parabacteroides sp.]